MPTFLDTRGRNKLAIAICSRCSCKYPYDDLQPDPNAPGLMCCPDGCLDELDPWRLAPRETEDITLENPRPDTPIYGDVGYPLPVPLVVPPPITETLAWATTPYTVTTLPLTLSGILEVIATNAQSGLHDLVIQSVNQAGGVITITAIGGDIGVTYAILLTVITTGLVLNYFVLNLKVTGANQTSLPLVSGGPVPYQQVDQMFDTFGKPIVDTTGAQVYSAPAVWI